MGFFCRTNLKEFVYLHYFIYIISDSTIEHISICQKDSCCGKKSDEHKSSTDDHSIQHLPSYLVRHRRQLRWNRILFWNIKIILKTLGVSRDQFSHIFTYFIIILSHSRMFYCVNREKNNKICRNLALFNDSGLNFRQCLS